jgi:DNA-binding IclR family transcriptional regulator
MPPYASAAGLLTLAFIRDEDVKLRIEEKYPFSEFGINLWKSRDALNSFLEQCREERSAVSPFDTDIFFRVSVPVFDRSGKFAAVIGASCPVRYFPQSEFPVIQQELQKEAEVFQKKIQ